MNGNHYGDDGTEQPAAFEQRVGRFVDRRPIYERPWPRFLGLVGAGAGIAALAVGGAIPILAGGLIGWAANEAIARATVKRGVT